MADATLSTADPADAPLIDEPELARVTFGDVALASELLSLFGEQAAMLVSRIGGAVTARAQREDAHRLCGAARAVAARRVDAAATALEERLVARVALADAAALPPSDPGIAKLARAVGLTCRAIALREAGLG
jgi:HPt (histidine-containing phosphotransfer) domain-containing protein